MPDSPDKAKFLNEDDKLIARARAARQVGSASAHRVGGINWKDVGAALMDLKVRSNPFDLQTLLIVLELVDRTHVLFVQR